MNMGKIELDIHTHTIASGHAYSTLQEMVASAQQKDLKILGITEHGPAIPGACHPIYFKGFGMIPRQWGDLTLLMGAEVNILNTKGELDLERDTLRRLDVRIAGIHSLCWTGGTEEENTTGLVEAIMNPWTDIISHPGDGTANLNFTPIVQAAKDSGTLLEINNSTLNPARNKVHALSNNKEILRLCKQMEVPVILGSDAHISLDIARYERLFPLLEELDFPDELVVNYSAKRFLAIVEKNNERRNELLGCDWRLKK